MEVPSVEDFALISEPATDPKLAKRREKLARNAIRKARATRVVRVLNLGAGVQSTALILMDALVHRQGRRDEVEAWLERDYPYPPLDFAIFADTQDEPERVYRHLPRLRDEDTAPILEGTRGRLGDDLIAGTNESGQFYSIPAFTADEPGVNLGLIRRQCTETYKVQVVERIIRGTIFGVAPGRAMPDDSKVIQSFGLSFDEPGRIAKVRARLAASPWAEASFPLADLEMERSDCISFLRSIGWDAPRSACVYCPFHDNAEWRDIRDNDPEGWARALEIDEAIRRPDSACTQGLDHKLYLHRSCVPLALAPIDEPDISLGFGAECEGMCGN
jgi:hypothetical protein